MRFRHLLVPVASEADASVTCNALSPYLEDVDRVTAVHVIEAAGDGRDGERSEAGAEETVDILGTVEDAIGGRVRVDTAEYYGSGVVEPIFEAARDVDADAVAFRARGGGRIARLLAGDVSTRLVTDPEVPVLALPGVTE